MGLLAQVLFLLKEGACPLSGFVHVQPDETSPRRIDEMHRELLILLLIGACEQHQADSLHRPEQGAISQSRSRDC